MLGRLVLFLLQIVLGWFGSDALMSKVGGSIPGSFKLFVFAVIASVVIYLIGVLAAQILKEVGAPSSATLSSTLLFALIAAALWTFGPGLISQIPWGKVKPEYAVLAGAILGYTIKK